ncbi:hypothetical protein [[Clostridium] fimetarium]|uniref:Uncharacterized protein n=1 Tax=[Clostridium] fimetarium TaxID=99656 RepID=A0A1I0QTB5_9FIRM|nr:hypothetical protein [[Clostridium] fimetarium]SEW30862.1 hypothetical protein SAMN05421659_10994 [[Clostridium] fimetarium]
MHLGSIYLIEGDAVKYISDLLDSISKGDNDLIKILKIWLIQPRIYR